CAGGERGDPRRARAGARASVGRRRGQHRIATPRTPTGLRRDGHALRPRTGGDVRRALPALVVLALAAAPARAEPSDRDLFYVGLALAPPTYLINVSLHEGSHALMAELVGGDVLDVHLFPPRVDPRVNKFRFGWVYARGLYTTTQRQLFYLAPKIT